MRILSTLLLALTLIAAAAPLKASSGSELAFVDTTKDFDRIWQETKDLPDAERVLAFKSQFAQVLPGFYDEKRVSEYIDPQRYDAMILRGLKAYPEQRAAIRQVSEEFSSLVAPAREQFEAFFGPMRGYPPIYLVNSFGEFDGGTRDLGDETHLFFGADMIARLYNGTSVKPLVEHELFHLMHNRTFPECEPVWCSLWEEGLATYVASQFNPHASDAALGLSVPQPIRPAVDTRRAEAICAVWQRLNSSEPEDYASLFYGNKHVEGFPPRMGYYVGLLVVSEAGRTRSLRQLASLSPGDARLLVQKTLEGMASCPEAKR